MSHLLNTIIVTGISGYLTSSIGILTGLLLSFFINRRGRRFRGTTLGFIGGLMLAIICFDLLPESFEAGSVYIVTIGITFGLLSAIILEGRIDHAYISGLNTKNKFLKAAIFMAIGIGIHNLPSGIALGALYSSPIKELHLAMALILHGIPEGIAIGIFLKENTAGLFSFLLISVFTSVPMGFGAIIGGIASSISPLIICISLSFASGMILYIIYKETLPSAHDTWNGRQSSIGNVAGMIAGMLMVYYLH